MVTLTRSNIIGQPPRYRMWLWLAAVSALTTSLVVLSMAIKSNPAPSQDLTVMDWLAGWDPPGLSAFFQGVSTLTGGLAAIGLGLAGIITLWLLRMRREALAFAVIGGIVGLGAFLADFAMGELVTRARPLAGGGAEVGKASDQAFPSGHVFGGTALFGFWGFLAIYYRMNKRLLVPFLAPSSWPLARPVSMTKRTGPAMWRRDTCSGSWCFCSLSPSSSDFGACLLSFLPTARKTWQV